MSILLGVQQSCFELLHPLAHDSARTGRLTALRSLPA